MNINPQDVCVQVVTKDGGCTPELRAWLHHMGVPAENIECRPFCNRDIPIAKNATLYRCLERARLAGLEWCLLADSDIRPVIGRSDALFEAPYAFTCVKCQTSKGAASWPNSKAWHSQLWMARRLDAALIPRPAFQWITDAAGGVMLGCCCSYFMLQAVQLGLSTGHVGWAEHAPAPDLCEST